MVQKGDQLAMCQYIRRLVANEGCTVRYEDELACCARWHCERAGQNGSYVALRDEVCRARWVTPPKWAAGPAFSKTSEQKARTMQTPSFSFDEEYTPSGMWPFARSSPGVGQQNGESGGYYAPQTAPHGRSMISQASQTSQDAPSQGRMWPFSRTSSSNPQTAPFQAEEVSAAAVDASSGSQWPLTRAEAPSPNTSGTNSAHSTPSALRSTRSPLRSPLEGTKRRSVHIAVPSSKDELGRTPTMDKETSEKSEETPTMRSSLSSRNSGPGSKTSFGMQSEGAQMIAMHSTSSMLSEAPQTGVTQEEKYGKRKQSVMEWYTDTIVDAPTASAKGHSQGSTSLKRPSYSLTAWLLDEKEAPYAVNPET